MDKPVLVDGEVKFVDMEERKEGGIVKMFDHEGYEVYVRQKISLERKLEETGDFRGNTEVKTQMYFVQERLLSKLKQVYYHATQELDALRMVLIQSCEDGEGGK